MEIIFNVYKNKIGEDWLWFLKNQLIYVVAEILNAIVFYYIRELLEVSLKIIRNKMITS